MVRHFLSMHPNIPHPPSVIPVQVTDFFFHAIPWRLDWGFISVRRWIQWSDLKTTFSQCREALNAFFSSQNISAAISIEEDIGTATIGWGFCEEKQWLLAWARNFFLVTCRILQCLQSILKNIYRDGVPTIIDRIEIQGPLNQNLETVTQLKIQKRFRWFSYPYRLPGPLLSLSYLSGLYKNVTYVRDMKKTKNIVKFTFVSNVNK